MDPSKKSRRLRIALTLGGCGALALACVHMLHAQAGPDQPDMTIDAATREAVVDAAVANLDRAYVFPAMAAQLHRQLEARVANGDFNRITSAAQFADALTDALREVSHDRHLEVRYMAEAVPERPANAGPSPQEQAQERIEQVRFNYGVSSVGRLQGNLGYIDLHQFGRPDGAAPRIAAAMSLLRDTQALVVDLRHCGGGDPDTVMKFASYLFDRPTHLNDIYWRDQNRTEVRWTQPVTNGLAYGEKRAVYLLTSPDTFSGCEDLAYALKNAHRATLVGQTTGGGAHAGDPHRLTAHFMMFVPSGRPINPVTHTDWEGTGVTPDVATSSGKALERAQILALKDLAAREADPDWKAKLQERIGELE
jgi:hypothetical protein